MSNILKWFSLWYSDFRISTNSSPEYLRGALYNKSLALLIELFSKKHDFLINIGIFQDCLERDGEILKLYY